MITRVAVAVVGGGLAGLCVADRLRRDAPDLTVRVYEASDRPGGKLLSERIETGDGVFLVEAGADAWLAQKLWASELVEELGLSGEVIPIARLPRPVAILKDGRPIDLPPGVSLIAPARLWPFLRSPLLSLGGKVRMAGDLVIRPRVGDADESLGAFVEHRLGRDALDLIAEPLAAGIYNADPDQMSLLATFPQLRRLEREHGSVIRGLRKASRKHLPSPATAGEGLGVRAGLEANGGWSSRWFGRGRPELRLRADDDKPTEGATGVASHGFRSVVAGLRTRLVVRLRSGLWHLQRFDRRRPGLKPRAESNMPAEAGSSVSLGEALSCQPLVSTWGGQDRNGARMAAGRTHCNASLQGATFLSLRGGMGTLVEALAERVRDAVEVNASVTGIISEPGGGYRLTFDDRTDVRADSIVLTVPAVVAAELLAGVAPDAAGRLRELRAVHAGTITLAYRAADILRPLPGYGLVIAAREGRPINAVTVASRKFAGRAPAGWELLRVFFGGYRSPATMELDDAALLEAVTAELRDLLGITAPPAFHRIHRWPAGSPQYDVGHLERVAAIETALPEGIAVTGSSYRGVGIPDVIHSARDVVAGLRTHLEVDTARPASARNLASRIIE